MGRIKFVNEEVFSLKQPENYSGLYFPIAGERGIKSSVTPDFGGDAKWNQNAFLLEPVSIANLHNNKGVRNVWCYVEGKGAWSAVGASAEEENKKFTDEQDESEIVAGFMHQEVTRKSEHYKVSAKVKAFVPIENDVEILHVTFTNEDTETQVITPTVAIPIYGRSADNIRDHRHVTSLLHRIKTTKNGVLVKPTLSFDERGHKKNELTYFVCGVTGTGRNPESFYPTIDTFIGEGGTMLRPEMVVKNRNGVPAGYEVAGQEAMGGLHFEAVTLAPGESTSVTVIAGITDKREAIARMMEDYSTDAAVEKAEKALAAYWKKAVNIDYHTGSKEFDGFMKWVSFQPFLRRIYGCSFLPHHDYGRGGRGWRDLWQDCLSLLIMDPSGVRSMVRDNFGGVRIDGTNATIIGSGQGEFIADRNGIARVWMDHGVWPWMTTKLYIDQTGDIDILNEQVTYFKDEQCKRGTDLDNLWNGEYGVCQKNQKEEVYTGSVLEHLLLEHLCSFYEVGEHNHMRLRGADWNDALDMAADNGESVAFSCAYAGNLLQISELLDTLADKYGYENTELLKEIEILLANDAAIYDDIDKKKNQLDKYLEACSHNVDGEKKAFSLKELAKNLKAKADWLMEHIRKTEWIENADKSEGWLNSYYDNHKQRVEGYFPNEVRMMLTGQVFSVMSQTATKEQVEKICKAADKYLYKEEIGGYRLNTDFHEEKYDLGRMFGFAYGEKENGAVFSHMTVMYANALYRRGHVAEGYKALNTLSDHAMDFESSKIYPGIPEYFDGNGRGLYHYLTGAASWYMLTFVTEAFGVRGEYGDLAICPKLVKEQFDENGSAAMELNFASKRFEVVLNNPEKLDYDEYCIKSAVCDDTIELTGDRDKVSLSKEQFAGLGDGTHKIVVTLCR